MSHTWTSEDSVHILHKNPGQTCCEVHHTFCFWTKPLKTWLSFFVPQSFPGAYVTQSMCTALPTQHNTFTIIAYSINPSDFVLFSSDDSTSFCGQTFQGTCNNHFTSVFQVLGLQTGTTIFNYKYNSSSEWVLSEWMDGCWWG